MIVLPSVSSGVISSSFFDPKKISGLALWLKADAGVSTTPEQYISQIIISGAGTTTSNGTYTRASGGNTTFNGPSGNIIINNGGAEWALFDTQLYDPNDEEYGNYSYFTEDLDFANWYISGENLGESPAPSGTITNSPTGITLVTAWADQSGNGNNANSSQETRPTFVSNILNSKPVLRFNGAGQQMALTSSIGGTEYSIFIVCKNNDNVNGSMFLWSTDVNYAKYIGSVTSENYNANIRNKFILSEDDVGSGEGDSIIAWSSTAVNNNYFIGTAVRNGGGKAYLNGSGGTNSVGTFGASNTFNLIGGYEFGYELDGDVAEIIAYNRALSDSERQKVEAYLNAKYVIY